MREAEPRRCARAERFLFFCDDDVVLCPDALEQLVHALERAPRSPVHGYAYCDYLGVVAPGAFHPQGHVFEQRNRPFDREALDRNNFVPTMSLFRREGFPGFDPQLARYHDWDVALTLARKEIVGLHVPEVLFHAHYLDVGITTGASDDDARWAIKRKHRIGGG